MVPGLRVEKREIALMIGSDVRELWNGMRTTRSGAIRSRASRRWHRFRASAISRAQRERASNRDDRRHSVPSARTVAEEPMTSCAFVKNI